MTLCQTDERTVGACSSQRGLPFRCAFISQTSSGTKAKHRNRTRAALARVTPSHCRKWPHNEPPYRTFGPRETQIQYKPRSTCPTTCRSNPLYRECHHLVSLRLNSTVASIYTVSGTLNKHPVPLHGLVKGEYNRFLTLPDVQVMRSAGV